VIVGGPKLKMHQCDLPKEMGRSSCSALRDPSPDPAEHRSTTSKPPKSLIQRADDEVMQVLQE